MLSPIATYNWLQGSWLRPSEAFILLYPWPKDSMVTTRGDLFRFEFMPDDEKRRVIVTSKRFDAEIAGGQLALQDPATDVHRPGVFGYEKSRVRGSLDIILAPEALSMTAVRDTVLEHYLAFWPHRARNEMLVQPPYKALWREAMR